jgi:diguanylate cyclase (GGDEF)-like protein
MTSPQLLRLVRGISATASDCFFDTLVAELTEMLGADFAFVAELTDREPLRGRTLASHGDGGALGEELFALDDRPDRQVIEHGFFSDGRYAGIALADGPVLLGWLAVLRHERFDDEDLVRAVLEFVGARASAELRARLLHEALAVAQAKARRDELTTLPNRAQFEQQVELALDSARPFAVLLVDLDRFNVINDSLGHRAGDALLAGTAHRIRAALRPCDLVARITGDEFAVLLDGASETEAADIASRIGGAVAVTFSIDDQDVYTTASIGIACARGQYADAGEILRDAATAMYRAKAAGKARAELFHDSMRVQAVERMQIEMDLRRAIEREQLHLVYQPIVAMSDRSLAGFEALLRWRHPARGLIPPSTFIPIAEETGSILEIGDWVLDRVCRDLTEWRHKLDDAIINVNLSAMQLQVPDLVQRIEETVTRNAVPARRVRLEITETAIAAHPESAARALHAVRSLGIQLCIDDFGVGYSSLISLLRYPFTSLKIDRSLIAGIATSLEHREMVTAVTTLARNLGLEVVAEGVETEEQFEMLEEIGIDFVQGYYVAEPRVVAELVA